MNRAELGEMAHADVGTTKIRGLPDKHSQMWKLTHKSEPLI